MPVRPPFERSRLTTSFLVHLTSQKRESGLTAWDDVQVACAGWVESREVNEPDNTTKKEIGRRQVRFSCFFRSTPLD